jgi:hypothetical protein
MSSLLVEVVCIFALTCWWLWWWLSPEYNCLFNIGPNGNMNKQWSGWKQREQDRPRWASGLNSTTSFVYHFNTISINYLLIPWSADACQFTSKACPNFHGLSWMFPRHHYSVHFTSLSSLTQFLTLTFHFRYWKRQLSITTSQPAT